MVPDQYYIAYTDSAKESITVRESNSSEFTHNEVNELTFKSSTQAVQYARQLAEKYKLQYVPFTGTPDTRGYIYL